MAVFHFSTPAINSLAPPPEKITAPVSGSKACNRSSPIAPRPQTTMLLVPSVEVTNGAARPPWLFVQIVDMVGGLVADTRTPKSWVWLEMDDDVVLTLQTKY